MARIARHLTLNRFVAALLGLLALTPSAALQGQQSQASDPLAAELLPDTTVIYVEIPQPRELIQEVLAHRVTASLSEQYKKALQMPQLLPVRAGLEVLAFGMQQSWHEMLMTLSEGGVSFAMDGKTQGVVLLVGAKDQEQLEKFRNVVLNLVRDTATREGREDPVKWAEYRGIQAYESNNVKFATLGRLLVVTNNSDLGKQVIDAYLDRPAQHLAATPRYQTLLQQRKPGVAAWGYADLERIRAALGEQNPLASGKAEDPGGEVVLGGLLSNLKMAPYAQVEVSLTDESLDVEFTTPHDPAWIGEERTYYFGPQGTGAAPRPIEVPDTILTLGTYRNLSEMWLRAGDLFNQDINDKFAEADSTLATLFSGRDFGEDILGAIRPELQLVIARQAYPEGAPAPALKLPSFALIAQLKQPEMMQRDFRSLFQNLVGFLNIVGAMNGQPQLDLDRVREDAVDLVTATYLPERDRPADAEVKIQYNFSPSLAFVGDHVVVSSTTTLAREIGQQLAQAKPAETDAPAANTYIRVNAPALHAVLSDNQKQLVAQNVLEEGHTQEEAEAQIKTLLELVQLVRQAELRLQAADTLQLQVRLLWQPAP